MSAFKDDIFAGQVALVTGGGSGICKGIAAALMRHGCDAVITSRKADKLNGAAAELEAETGRACLAVVADVRDPASVEAVFDRTLERFGRVDHVINGAAGNFLAPAAALSYNGFKTVLEIDALGTFNVCRAAFTKWFGAHGGTIQNISATLHYNGQPLQVHVGSAKAAIDAMTKHLAVEWGPMGIRVNAIAPGPIDETEGMKRLLDPALKDKLTASIPLKRLGRISDVADASVFLASPAASFVTGAVLVVDGGSWMTMNGFALMAGL